MTDKELIKLAHRQAEAMKLAMEALKQIDEAMPFPVAKLAQAVLREALNAPLVEQPAQRSLPDFLVYDGYETPQYIEGWNDCRELMKGMR